MVQMVSERCTVSVKNFQNLSHHICHRPSHYFKESFKNSFKYSALRNFTLLVYLFVARFNAFKLLQQLLQIFFPVAVAYKTFSLQYNE